MKYSPHILRAAALLLCLNISHLALAQSDGTPITDEEIAIAVEQYEELLAKEQLVEDLPHEGLPLGDLPLDDLSVEVFPLEDTPIEDLPPDSLSAEDAEIIDIITFRDTVISRAIENGAKSSFIINAEDPFMLQAIHEGIETDFHLTNVYQDYADNPEVDLDSAIETLTFLIESTEKNRFITPDDAIKQPWLIDEQEETQDDWDVELIDDQGQTQENSAFELLTIPRKE